MEIELFFEDISLGDEIVKLIKEPVSKIQLVKYSGASGDFNPIHTDPEAGKAVGIGGQIAHGMLVMGFAGQAVTDSIPKRNLRKLNVRFAGMTRPGDVITITGIVIKKYRSGDENIVKCEIDAKNQKDELIISGEFEAFVPGKS